MSEVSPVDGIDLPSIQESEARLQAIGARMGDRMADVGGSLPEWWERRAEKAGDRPLIKRDTHSLSYREFDALTRRIAARGHALGIGTGDTIAISLPACAAFLALVLGLSRLGARFSLLSTGLRGRSLRHALEEVPSTHLFTDPSGDRAVADLDGFASPPRIVLDLENGGGAWLPDSGLTGVEDWLEGNASSVPPTAPPRPADETLFYIFTSGTTGLPKATQCSHRRYIAGGTSEGALLDLQPDDCMYVVLPMFHIAALSAIGAALSSEASLVIRPRFSASRFWDDVRRFDATAIQYLGEILRYLLAQPPSANDRPNPLRAMIGAGLSARVWRAFVERFGPIEIVESYGSSEGVIGLINLDQVPGSVGRPAPDVAARLRIVRLDPDTEEPIRDASDGLVLCDEGESGELISRLEERSEFEGYSSAKATASKLIDDAFEKGDLWYRSGDRFRCRSGFYFFVSRLGDTFRWKGENVSAQEVARALEAQSGVAHATVYAVRVPEHEGAAGMAMIALDAGASFDPAGLVSGLGRELPPHALPLFLRVGDGRSVLTETYKLGVAALKRQGYDSALVPDPLYLLDTDAREYVPLSHDRLTAAGIRLP